MLELVGCSRVKSMLGVLLVSIPVVLKAGDGCWLCDQTITRFSLLRASDVLISGKRPGVRLF